MAHLSDTEKEQMLAAIRRKTPRPPRLPVHSTTDFLTFATFASGFSPKSPKPVRFGGKHWKL